ncbi:hypothetical protein [Puniceicoccus vermicola]|uniref:Uncharacterized protein n=1 Tax=Puniceicoccus vermicola TaxID=388746 RepID=A0A7X1B0H0_9BACT|nr:hypothetical protein [Puniceicoccus vermicola]MBC2602278.1 hypothetical protein [Puniceicoccus vermicola]
MRSTELDGVLFFEGTPDGWTMGEPISTEIEGLFCSAQLASLKDVKLQMVSECKRRGYHAIVQFEYGQRSSGFLASLFSRDDVKWYAKGILARRN